MARKSKLTEQQWNEILDRNLAGESIRSLAKEYGISAMAVQKKISLQAEKVKTVANQVVTTEKAVFDLPISLQSKVYTLAERIRAINYHLAGAAEYGAATAHRMSQIANTLTEQIDETDPESNLDKIRTVAALSDTANRASSIAVSLAKNSADKPIPADEPNANPTPEAFRKIAKELLEAV